MTLCGLHRLNRDLSGAFAQCGEDPASVKPTDRRTRKDPFPIEITRAYSRSRSMTPIGDSDGSSQPEPTLGEIQPVPERGTRPFGINPFQQRGIDTGRKDQRLDETTHLVVDESSGHRAPQTEAGSQSADDVVLAATLVHGEGAGRADPPLAGIEAQHHLTECQRIIPAGTGGEKVGKRGHGRWEESCAASEARVRIVFQSPASTALRSTNQDPPTAATFPRAR